MGQKQQTANNQGRGFKEFIRKFVVTLKRNPQYIALVALAAAFLVFSLNLTSISNTTAKINVSNMGQCEFAAMLFSILAFICFLRSFPKRQKPNMIMLGLMFLMQGIIIFVDAVYLSRINEALTREVSPIVIKDDMTYITTTQNVLTTHIVLVIVCIALVALIPVYGKLLKQIDTSVNIEGNGDMAAIDISGED